MALEVIPLAILATDVTVGSCIFVIHFFALKPLIFAQNKRIFTDNTVALSERGSGAILVSLVWKIGNETDFFGQKWIILRHFQNMDY